MTREQYETQPSWYEFGAWNQEAVYGYGTQADADEYLDILNKDRAINIYAHFRITDYDAENVLKLHDRNDTINLSDELAARKGLR